MIDNSTRVYFEWLTRNTGVHREEMTYSEAEEKLADHDYDMIYRIVDAENGQILSGTTDYDEKVEAFNARLEAVLTDIKASLTWTSRPITDFTKELLAQAFNVRNLNEHREVDRVVELIYDLALTVDNLAKFVRDMDDNLQGYDEPVVESISIKPAYVAPATYDEYKVISTPMNAEEIHMTDVNTHLAQGWQIVSANNVYDHDIAETWHICHLKRSVKVTPQNEVKS